MIAPAKTRVTLPYGATMPPYTNSSPHAGTDFSWEGDANIYAPEDGTITFSGWLGSAGSATELTSGWHVHRMCHQSKILVSVGQAVRKGQIIGVMGDTGLWPDGSKSAQGVHLHWVMFEGGKRVDGMKYVNETNSKEDLVVPDKEHLDALYRAFRGRESKPDEQHFINTTTYNQLVEALDAGDERAAVISTLELGRWAARDNWQQQIYVLQKTVDDFATRPTMAQLDELKKQVETLSSSANGVAQRDLQVEIDGVRYIPEATR